MEISCVFSNNFEQATIELDGGFSAELPKQPIGTWALDILNADLSALADILVSCADETALTMPSVPLVWQCDFSKLSAATPAIQKILASLFPFYNDNDPDEIWHGLILDFAGRFPNGEPLSGENVDSFKKFLDELWEKPEYYTFDFLNFLNISGNFRPVSIHSCISYTSHAESNCSNSSGHSLEELYSDFLRTTNFSSDNVYKYSLGINRWMQRSPHILVASFLELTRQGKTIRKCANCGKYFIPENRKDTLYCSNQSPQDSTRSCKQYGSERLWYERQKDDEIATLSRNILSSKSMLAKRSNNYRPYIVSYDYFRSERLKWKKAVENGEKTKEEYKEWLLKMKSQKIIEEAVHGND